MSPRARRLTLAYVLILCISLPAAGAWAQEGGVAVITSPLEGGTLTGLVSLTGTALHPQFQRYELAFGYDPNSTDTWFAIQAPSSTQIANDVIGRWDTTTIADGVYVLRLRVYFSDTGFLEALVHRVHVQNATPTAPPTVGETPATQPAAQSPGETAPAAGTATQPLIVLPPTSTPRAAPAPGEPFTPERSPGRLTADVVRQAFLNGVGLTLGAFALLGFYHGWRAFRRSRPKP